MITDGTGALVELAEYRPYGGLARREGPVEVPQKFTGQRLDPTGFYFYQARYYDPTLGRFLQADPVVPSPGDPQALNRYSYVRNNPLKYTDPTGHGWFSKFWRSIVGIAAAAISFFVPPLAPAMWALNTGIGVATAIQTGNVGGFVGSLVGGAVFGIFRCHNTVFLCLSPPGKALRHRNFSGLFRGYRGAQAIQRVVRVNFQELTPPPELFLPGRERDQEEDQKRDANY